MSLQITTIKDTIIAKGSLNASTVNSFKEHINYLFSSGKSVNLNLDKLSNIDNNGLFAIYKLVKDSSAKNQRLIMVGKKSSEVFSSIAQFV